MLKKIRYIAEFFIVIIGVLFFKALGYKRASNIAAKIAIFVGKKIKVHQLAYDNMSQALPHLNHQQKNDILHKMWDNLGRIVGEYPHIGGYNDKDLAKIVSYSENFKKNIKTLQDNKKGGIIVSGHIGNWEVGPKSLMAQGLKINVLYRPLNNPYVEKLSAKMRGINLIEKSAKGSRQIIEAIKKGEYVIILADQKVSEGEPVKFFHDLAITTTSIARLALKYDILVAPARVIRDKNNHNFTIDLEEPITKLDKNAKNSKKSLDVVQFTAIINQTLEKWIKEYPSQWFWVHDRWKRSDR